MMEEPQNRAIMEWRMQMRVKNPDEGELGGRSSDLHTICSTKCVSENDGRKSKRTEAGN